MVYVGRVSVEKNIEAFLDLDLPGSKLVVGGGPQLEKLKSKYPDVTFTGPKFGEELAAHYRSGDVFSAGAKPTHIRFGDTGSHGLRTAGGRLSGHRTARCIGRLHSRKDE